MVYCIYSNYLFYGQHTAMSFIHLSLTLSCGVLHGLMSFPLFMFTFNNNNAVLN